MTETPAVTKISAAPDTPATPRATAVTVPIEIDRTSTLPLPDQLVAEFRRLISLGALRPGEPVPSSRRLSVHLGVSRGTIETAYEQLGVEGYLVTRERAATRINPELPAALGTRGPKSEPPGPPKRLPRNSVDLRPGYGGDNPLREPAFRKAWRDSLDVEPGPIDALGQPHSRWAVAEHLRLLRGMSLDADDVVLTSGSRDGLRLLFTAGVDGPIAVENPGFPGLRLAMTDRELVPFDVSNGIDERELDRISGLVAAIVLTPNHQFPHGTTLPVDRRVKLLNWAQAHDIVVIEDDYDSEARYRRTIVPSLYNLAQSLDINVRVVHIGTFSTLLTSAVSTGYIVTRGKLAARIKEVRRTLGPAFSPVMQTALANYLSSGGLRRRISRGRRRLRAAEAVVADIGAIPGLVHDGRTLVFETDAAGAQELKRQLSARGILVASLADGWSGDSDVRHGIVIAHSNVSEDALRAALLTIRELLSR